jgi:hypothetical protein
MITAELPQTPAQSIAAVKMAIRSPYTFPGGYPVYIITADCGCLCPDCCKKEFRQIVQYTLWGQRDSGWCAVASDINWASEIACDHCGKPIPSAYEVTEVESA